MIPRSNIARALRHSAPSRRSVRTLTRARLLPTTNSRCASHAPTQILRWASSTSGGGPSINNAFDSGNTGRTNKSEADVKIEEITELYATAQDEFEIAMEETEKASIYAEDDRKAAREELTRVQEAYKAVLDGTDQDLANEVKRRIGQRIRELEQGVVAMEELALNQD
ncbi:hypothetical protein CKM354_000361800 [Cercospora kikuchii]|uniref:Uncharacterized protein n=1 Tax=Cercospora kikuchii TaxID=84275 RepID=A0A9P3CBM7_9PEZI|nr:uncharacterized protein CKM354_000361800 [Cercospora kikuchii]GIZ40272.1 hypothetical protein CKM354_000361800 [Cercospora kikuchii]